MGNYLKRFKEYYPEIILFIVTIVLLFSGIFTTPIVDGDTFYYIAKAKKMIATQNFLGTNNIMAKPILCIWIMSFFYKFVSISLFSTYFWHSIFSLLSIVLVYHFGKTVGDRNCGILSAGVLLTSFLFFYQLNIL